jgi:hypothetical protein
MASTGKTKEHEPDENNRIGLKNIYKKVDKKAKMIRMGGTRLQKRQLDFADIKTVIGTTSFFYISKRLQVAKSSEK